MWQPYTATAEKYNEFGRFTAMIGYEWTSVPGGNNLHRNVLFRHRKDKADRVVPFSAWQSEDPEDLWAWMDRCEKDTGGRVLAIPHNPNASKGFMFEPLDNRSNPLTADYARTRSRWEPLIETMQIKANSEVVSSLWPADEFADFENGLSVRESNQRMFKRENFVRWAVTKGLACERVGDAESVCSGERLGRARPRRIFRGRADGGTLA